MKPNSRQLAMRDTALAAAMGILGTSTYGAEPARQRGPSFGSEWSGELDDDASMYSAGYYGYHGDPSVGFGVDAGFGYGGAAWGNDMGFGFGADPVAAVAAQAAHPAVRAAMMRAPAAAAHPAHPLHPAQAPRTMAIVEKHARETARTAQRESLLHPNKGSRTDIERYDFSLNQTPNLVLGTASTIAMSTQPAVTVRPQRCTFNAPSFGFVQISSILSANVNGLVGGSLDAGAYSATAFGVHLDLPTLSPANKLSVNGSYSGLVPPGFPLAFSFPFTVSFQCPATVVA
jgi:hypothetical protein